MSRFTEVMDGFVKDENENFHFRPMKLPDYMTRDPSEQKRETFIKREFIPLEPLGPREEFFKSAELAIESLQNILKEPKVKKNQIRKELFKPLQKKPVGRFMSYGTTTSLFSVSKKPQASGTKKTKTQTFFDDSPLLHVDEAEKLLKQNKPVIKPVKNVLLANIEITEVNTTVPKNRTPVRMLSAIPETTRTISEFEKDELENLQIIQFYRTASASAVKARFEYLLSYGTKASASCEKIQKPHVSSPSSSICTSLENPTIKTSEGNSLEKNTIIKDVLLLINEEQQRWDTFKRQFLNYQEEHNKTLNKIGELLGQFEENKKMRAGTPLE